MACYVNHSPQAVALPGEPGGGDRWVVSKKLELIRRIRAGEIAFDQACARFDLSAEELETWVRRQTKFGSTGLKVRLIQRYRA